MDVTAARLMPGSGVQLIDVQALQSALDIVSDGQPVGALHEPGGVGLGRFTQFRPGGEQLVEHGGLLGPREAVQR
jgi:hypothetical protein